MNEYSDFRTANIDILSEPKLILAVICSLASKIVWQDSDTIAKAAEELMQTYRDMGKCPQDDKKQPSSLFNTATILDENLSTIDKAIYTVLCSLADNETHQCSPKVKTIAKKASCSERSVQKSLNTLEKRNLIHRKNRFINHRQISSLYTVIGSQTEYIPSTSREAETDTHDKVTENEIQNNAYCSDEVSNITEQNPTYFEGRTECGERAYGGCNERTPLTPNPLQSEKTLESLKIPYGGACLPASAEKESEGTNARISEEVIPEEKTKDSLTGGALLPISECEKQNPENPLEGITDVSETNTEENPIIRAESNRTAQADTAQTAVCENPVIKAESDETDNLHNTSQPKSELSEALLREYDQLRSEYTRNEKPTEGPKSVASVANGVLAKIMKKRVIKSGDCGAHTVPENLSVKACETPVIKTEAMNATEIPATDVARAEVVPAGKSFELPTECDALMVSAAPAMAEHVPATETACDTSATSSKAQTENVSAPKDTVKKPLNKSGKGKGTVSRHPKERYSPEDAPEIMRSTAEYFLYKTGRVALRWEEIAVLRKFSATQYPAVVQKEIRRACARFKKRNESLACLTLMYIEVALRDRPTFGSKAKAKKEANKAETQSSSTVKEKTEEEKAAEEAQAAADMARMEELQAQMNERIRIDHEERCKRLFGIKRICRVGVEEANAGVEVSSREESRSE